MIKETLKTLFIDNCTLMEAAERLGTDQRSIRERLVILQHMGYVEEVCNNSAPRSASCCSCSSASSCSDGDRDNEGKAYQLTKKGEKISGN